MPLQMSMSKLMGVYSNYKLPKFYEIIYIVAFGVGLKCPRIIHLNTQRPTPSVPASLHYERPCMSYARYVLTLRFSGPTA